MCFLSMEPSETRKRQNKTIATRAAKIGHFFFGRKKCPKKNWVLLIALMVGKPHGVCIKCVHTFASASCALKGKGNFINFFELASSTRCKQDLATSRLDIVS